MMTWNELMDEHGMVHNTFYEDFAIADAFGEKAVSETYERCKEWRSDYKMYTALVFALNYRAWKWAETNESLCSLYCKLFEEARDWGYDNLKDDALTYFWQKLD